MHRGWGSPTLETQRCTDVHVSAGAGAHGHQHTRARRRRSLDCDACFFQLLLPCKPGSLKSWSGGDDAPLTCLLAAISPATAAGLNSEPARRGANGRRPPQVAERQASLRGGLLQQVGSGGGSALLSRPPTYASGHRSRNERTTWSSSCRLASSYWSLLALRGSVRGEEGWGGSAIAGGGRHSRPPHRHGRGALCSHAHRAKLPAAGPFDLGRPRRRPERVQPVAPAARIHLAASTYSLPRLELGAATTRLRRTIWYPDCEGGTRPGTGHNSRGRVWARPRALACA